MMAAFDIPFINIDMSMDMGWTMSGAPMADPISRSPSARAQMLYGIGTNHLDMLRISSHFPASLDFDGHRVSEHGFYAHQKLPDMSYPPFDLRTTQECYQHDIPPSENSSQSGDTFSASCCTDNRVLRQHSLSPPVNQAPYFTNVFQAQSPEMSPTLAGGVVSLGDVQLFQDQTCDRTQDFQDSAYSEPDAEGESDHEYPEIVTSLEPAVKRLARPERIHKPSVAESIDSMSEAYEPNEEDDTDYKPRGKTSSRPRRPAAGRRISHSRRLSNGTSTGRITKPKPRKGSNATQVRPFPCPLAQYGCLATFVSKNEWKRHVSTQHIKLGFWRCDMCPAGDPGAPVYNDFNRKDLFTQHLRRMHRNHPLTTSTVVNEDGETEISDDAMVEHQARCYLVLRSNPAESKCLFKSCDKRFNGENSWEERMEHVGSHMEKERKANKSVVSCEQWHEDIDLRDYLEQEGLIEYDNGKWSIGDGIPKRD